MIHVGEYAHAIHIVLWTISGICLFISLTFRFFMVQYWKWEDRTTFRDLPRQDYNDPIYRQWPWSR